MSTTPKRWAILATAVTVLAIAAGTYELAPKFYRQLNPSSKIETMDVVALARQVRDAVVLLDIYDRNGKEIATGSGFFVTKDGILVTNYHVIENAARVVAKSENGAKYAVLGILAAKPKADIALLRVEANKLAFLELGDSQKAEVGQSIAVVGSPFGLEGTISEGIISAKRELSTGEKLLQITAPISAGSSGSPVVDAGGRVVGVAAMLLRESQSLNFAVPVEVPKDLLAGLEPNVNPIAFGALPAVSKEIFDDKDFLAAVHSYLAGDYARALTQMKSIQKRFPNSELFYLLLGETFEEVGFLDDAITAFQQSIKLKPDFDASWEGLGIAYEKQKRNDDAVGAIKQAIKINPSNPGFWNRLGAFYDAERNFYEAVNAFKQAAKLDPNDFPSRFNLGRAYCTIAGLAGHSPSESADAIAPLEEAVRLKPDYVGAWEFLALAYFGTEKYDSAVVAYSELVRLEPDNHGAWYSLGCAYLNLGRPIDAIGPLEKATKLKPDHAASWKYLASAYYRSNQSDRALEAFKRYKALHPGE